jgi:predicted AlkP superfamily pyrophosphatase or phosphodiesterase
METGMQFRFLALMAAIVLTACARPQHAGGPRLVVLIVADQMRADRFMQGADTYAAGLARLHTQGRVYENASHAHAMTWTAAGHATLASGVHPSRSGIIGNTWWERPERARVSAAKDPQTRRLDQPDLTGSSGFRMRVATLGDWLKQESPDSQVWSLSIKDRAAAIMAGRQADGAYWYDFDRGRFVSSDYYMEQEPDWALAFNEERSIEAFRDGWDLLLDPSHYQRADEGAGEDSPATFPHLFSDGDAFYKEIYSSPFGDQFTFEFVQALIDGQKLGADDASDLLFISASSGDEIGHSYGPWSREVEDYDARFDRMLGGFFEHLDATVGPGQWLVVLTSDHGVLPLPEQTVGGQRHSWDSLRDPMQADLAEALAAEGLDPSSVSLDYTNGWILDADPEIDPQRLSAVRTRLAAKLKQHPRIEDVFTWDELASDTPLDRAYEAEFRRSFDPERSADLMLRFHEFDLGFAGRSGTNHGSAYPYDSNVPLVFMGAGVQPQRVDTPIRTVDVAPTLARCLGIDPPAGLDGEVSFECSAPTPPAP